MGKVCLTAAPPALTQVKGNSNSGNVFCLTAREDIREITWGNR